MAKGVKNQDQRGSKMQSKDENVKTEAERIKELENSLGALRALVLKQEKEGKSNFNKASRDISVIKNRLDDFTPHIVERFLNESRQDAIEVHRKYRLLILKQTVATETSFLLRTSTPDYLPFIAKTIVRAFDESDEWWTEKEHFTLAEWVKVFIRQAAKYKERDTHSEVVA